MAFPDPKDIKLIDDWFGSQSTWEDRPILVRGRLQLKEVVGHPQYSERLNVIWLFEDNGDSGMPEPEQDLEMTDFENELIEHLERDNEAILAAVVTHAGQREWIFYCQDIEESVDQLNDAFADEPQKPLELEGVDDPEWGEYLGILENFTSGN